MQETHKKLATLSVGNSRDNPLKVDAVTWRKQEKHGGERPTQWQCSQPQNRYRKQQSPSKCTRCGRESHSSRVCPAREADCGKLDHFSVQCRSKNTVLRILVVEDTDAAVDTGFLDTLTEESSGPAVWTVAVGLDEQTVHFKVDTGAEVTAISDFSFRQLNGFHLRHASKVLYGPDHSRLDVLRKFSPTLTIEASRTVRTTQ